MLVKKWIVSVLAVFLLVGCATVVPYNKKAMSLQIGMTKQEAVNLLGTPKKVAARKTSEGLEEKYSYWGLSRVGYISMDNEMLSQDRLYVTLLDGKVIEWGDKYDPSTMMDKTLEISQKNAEQYREIYQNQNKK
jgi:outer membrane protein assembly factor BamE (lipoprotein component of BamABCDE complex)